MKFCFTIFMLCLIAGYSFAQSYPRPEIDLDKFVQDLFGQQTGLAPYNDIYESVFQYYRSPLDLNKANKQELENLYILSPYQIGQFLEYRNQNGKLLSIYELQAIKSFDKNTIDKLLPFVVVSDEGLANDTRPLWQRIREEENNYAILRYERVLEQQKGFKIANQPGQSFLGSADYFYARYRVQRKNDFSIGLTMEKDAGEQLIWSPPNRQYGMDYYSAHFALYQKGVIKSFVIGDYQLQIGQGLAMSAGFYMGKGAEAVTTIKRSNQGIRPYTGAMETGFLRGGAATIGLWRFNITPFISYRKLDGNILSADTLRTEEKLATSFLLTGLHRTQNELIDKDNISQSTGGLYVQYASLSKNFQIGASAIKMIFDPGIQKKATVYNQFDFRGTSHYQIGIDFNYYWRNINFFGEYNRSQPGADAFIAGILASLTPQIDVSVLGRSYDRAYQSFYGNTFGELSNTKNERGVYLGIKYAPLRKLSFTAYYDQFIFPWLTSRTDAPSEGREYMLRINYMPSKKITLYAQWRDESKQLNQSDNQTAFDQLATTDRRNLLLNLDYKADKIISLKTRIQISGYDQKEIQHSGIMMLQDITIDLNRIKISGRVALFDAKDFNTRFYVFEKNALYNFSMPLYYGQGIREYLLIQYKLNKNTDIWLKLARFEYRNQDKTGSSLNEINGNTKTDITVQVKMDF